MVSKIYKAYADWCGPCRQLAKELSDFNRVSIESINIDDDTDFCDRYNIRNIPVLIFVDKDNNEIARNVGFITKASLEKKIDELNENV